MKLSPKFLLAMLALVLGVFVLRLVYETHKSLIGTRVLRVVHAIFHSLPGTRSITMHAPIYDISAIVYNGAVAMSRQRIPAAENAYTYDSARIAKILRIVQSPDFGH